MKYYSTTNLTLVTAFLLVAATRLPAQSAAQSAASRMQPIGAPSAVDQYRSATSNETAFWQASPDALTADGTVRQTAMLQGGGFGLPSADLPPAMPPTTTTAPPITTTPGPASSSVTLPTTRPYPIGAPPPTSAPRTLPTPSPSSGNSILSPSDLAPMQQPSLNQNAFATPGNCHLITGPSGYSAAMDCGCGTVVPATYASDTGPPITTPSGTVVSPTTLPAQIPSTATTLPPTIVVPQTPAPQPTAPPKTAPRAFVSLGQTRYPVQVGQGLWGQPVAYVPGQGFRNWFRYMFP